MAPLCEAATINTKSLVVRAAQGMAEEKFNKEDRKRFLFRELKNANKQLEMVDRLMSLTIRDGKVVNNDLARRRRNLKNRKASVAAQLKELR